MLSVCSVVALMLAWVRRRAYRLISCLSTWPKACIQVTGKCMRGGSGSPLITKPHVYSGRARQATRDYTQPAPTAEPGKLPVGTSYAENSIIKGPHSPDPERAPSTAALGKTSTERLLKSQVRNRLPKTRRTKTAICTFNARTLASEASVEDLLMQARKIKYVVIGLNETRRHRPLTPPMTPVKNCSLEHAIPEALAVWVSSSTRTWP